ncbi:MAG: FecR family protein [Steroidobacteraceae bacterium]
MAKHGSTIKPEAAAEAAAWFAEFRAEDVTSGTRARFDDWLRQSPQHIEAYIDVAAGWAELPTADPEGRIDVQALVARARESHDENVVTLRRADKSGRRANSRARMQALAASLALISILSGAIAWVWLYRADTYSTGIGEQRTLVLADGSTVILDALTTVRVRFSKTARAVDLIKGQAYFHDTYERGRPFVVRSDEATIRAIGTQFDVHQQRDGMIVTVVEGKVAVAETSQAAAPASGAGLSSAAGSGASLGPPSLAPVFVSAGEQVTLTAQLIRQPERVDVSAATAWVQKRLNFDNTPLEKVAAQFNLYSSRRLVIVDPALRSVEISGVYSSADPVSLIGFLRAQPNLLVTETDGEIRVSLRRTK